MSKRIPISEAQIARRIEFLIREARSDDAIRDQTVTYAFRVITNFLAVGDDVSARKLAESCPYRSKRAHELAENNPTDWLNAVTNEHQYPIKRAWEWMCSERDRLSASLVKEHLSKWPVVVVTVEENRLLRDEPDVEPAERYARAGIEILKRDHSGEWRLFRP